MRKLRTEEVALLIKKKLDDTISIEENTILQNWANTTPENRTFLNEVLADDAIFKESLLFIQLSKTDELPWENRLETLTLAKIKATRKSHTAIRSDFQKTLPYVAAALALIFMAIGYLWRTSLFVESDKLLAIDIMPKEVKVILKTDKGIEVSLDPNKNGLQMSPFPTYLDGEPIKDFPKDYESVSIEVPNSGDFKVVLEDGSNIWLNAASSLKYPKHFNNEQRIVELKGEGFFNITKTASSLGGNKPFLVKTNKQIIKVLGTTFNVQSYNDEPVEKTTLIEGAVILTAGKENIQLAPGEQGIVFATGDLQKQQVYVDDVAGWRSNKFIFNNTDLHQTARMLSRWYDIEIVILGDIPDMQFYGEISRDKNLNAVLKILEKSNLSFTLTTDKKLLVTYNKL